MAVNIPNIGTNLDSLMGGIKTGSGMFANLMHPVLEREKLKQLENHFQEQLGLSKAAAGRAAQAAADNHRIAMNKLDPTYQAKQYEALENYFKNKGNVGGQQTNPKMPVPQQEMGEGLGAFTPQGMQEAQTQPQIFQGGAMGGQGNNMGGVDLELMRQHPMLRGAYKKFTGIDPLAPIPQTPEDKQASALDLFKQKEEIKAANKTGSGETLTAPIKTKYQNVIGGVSTARPILQKLIEETKKGNIPGQAIGSLFKRDSQASYKGEISTLLDGVRNAYTIPNTDSGTAKAEDKVLRKSGESDANYAKRLQSILDQMDYREKDARVKLNAGNITASLVHLVGPNGEDYDVPASEVDKILSENPGVKRG